MAHQMTKYTAKELEAAEALVSLRMTGNQDQKHANTNSNTNRSTNPSNNSMVGPASIIPTAGGGGGGGQPQPQPGYRYSCYICGLTFQQRIQPAITHMVKKHDLQRDQVDRARIEAEAVQMLW